MNNRQKNPHPAAALLSIVLTLALATPALAAQAARPDQTAAREITLPEAALGQTLIAISNAWGVDVVGADSLVSGKRAPALAGVFTLEEALTRALDGAGLGFNRSKTGAYVVTEAVTDAGNPARRLDSVAKPGAAEEVIVVGRREAGYVSRTQSAGTFGEQSLFDTPFSVSVIPQELLIDQQVRALGDIARNDPSTLVDSSPGYYDTVNIRGYALDNSSSYRREGLIFQNQVQSPFENKAAVEIVKGPTSVRYGFTPPGGVVNYVLKRPTAEPYRWAQVFGDSYGSYGLHLDLGGRVNDELGFRFNGVASHEAAFVDGVAGPRQMFSALFEWTPTDQLRIDLEGEYQYRELENQVQIRLSSFAPSLSLAERQALLERFNPSTLIEQSWGVYRTRNFIGSLGIQYELNDAWRLHGRVQQMRLVRDDIATVIARGSLQANGDFIHNSFYSPGEVRDPLSAEVFVTGRFNTFGLGHDLAFGGALSRNPLRFSLSRTGNLVTGQSNIFNPVALPLPAFSAGPVLDAVYFNQRAVFVSDLITLTDQLKLFGALRWSEQENRDRFNSARVLKTTYKDSTIAPNAGLLYTPFDGLTLYGNYSQGITSGAQVPRTATNFGRDRFLDPAETEQFELGAKFELFNNAIFTAAYFDISQPLAALNENDLFGYIGSQNHRGAEVTLSGNLTDSLRLVAGGLYLDAEIANPNDPSLNGKRPSSVPEFQFNLFADYEVSFLQGLALNSGFFYTGDRFADNRNNFKVDDYVRLDLGARYRFKLGGQSLTARLNLRNVTDERFIEGISFGQFLFGSPRAAFLSLAVEF